MAENCISIEYNESLRSLEELLSGVERAGDFFVSGSVEIPMPKMEVEGVGVLSFPVPSTQIAALIGQAVRAPYGRGEETILDESVRKVWQLPPAKVRLGGKSWAANFDGILKQVVAGLGCEGMGVSAELYKLLVYDQGGFFLAHRDTEKADGMFGTLIVGLPSAHRGGELVVRHAGREVTLNLSGSEVSEVSFAAFYADCEHEVRPVTEGNRLCLVYNLLQDRAAKGKSQAVKAPEYEKQMVAAARMLEESLSAPDAPAKLAWLLDHQYSPDGLAFASLKSSDAARVKVLAQAAERAGCAVHLGIVHIEEYGAAEPIYHSYRSRRSRRWRSDDEEDQESEETGGEEFEVVDVSDGRHYMSQWRDLRDQPVEFGEIPLKPGELLPAGALDDEKPDKQRLTEASGNEGASFERSYHRAALAIWRRERYAEVLLQSGVAAALPFFKERVEMAGAASAPKSARKEAVALARLLIQAWQDAPEYATSARSGSPRRHDTMLGLLHELGEAALLEEFIAEVVAPHYDGGDNAALVTSARLLGAAKTGPLFSGLVRHNMGRACGDCVELLSRLAAEAKTAAHQEYRHTLRLIAEAAVSKLDEIGQESEDHGWMDWRADAKARAVDAALVTKMLDVFDILGADELRDEAAKKFAARSEVFDPVTILAPALAEARKWHAGLWKHSVEFLLLRSAQPPTAPKDWRLEAKISCSCADCRELRAFALDPASQTYRFRVRQDRRQHLHQQIESNKLDMTHVTEHIGSPQTLVCKKDRRSYLRRCDQYRKDMAALAALLEQARKTSYEGAGLVKRIEAACALAAEWSAASV